MNKIFVFCLLIIVFYSSSALARCITSSAQRDKNLENADAVVEAVVLEVTSNFKPVDPIARENQEYISWKSDKPEFDLVRIEIKKIYKNSKMLESLPRVIDTFRYVDSGPGSRLSVVKTPVIMPLYWSSLDKKFQIKSGECALEFDHKKLGIEIKNSPEALRTPRLLQQEK